MPRTKEQVWGAASRGWVQRGKRIWFAGPERGRNHRIWCLCRAGILHTLLCWHGMAWHGMDGAQGQTRPLSPPCLSLQGRAVTPLSQPGHHCAQFCHTEPAGARAVVRGWDPPATDPALGVRSLQKERSRRTEKKPWKLWKSQGTQEPGHCHSHGLFPMLLALGSPSPHPQLLSSPRAAPHSLPHILEGVLGHGDATGARAGPGA